MTLQNLLRIGKLKEHLATALEIKRLLIAIERNLHDSAVPDISDETRFDTAYKAVMQCALAAMLASGYRPSTGETGHHMTLLQSLPLTLGVTNEVWVVLDALRRKRNANDYLGDVIGTDMVAEAAAQAGRLFILLKTHLKQKHPQLLRV